MMATAFETFKEQLAHILPERRGLLDSSLLRHAMAHINRSELIATHFHHPDWSLPIAGKAVRKTHVFCDLVEAAARFARAPFLGAQIGLSCHVDRIPCLNPLIVNAPTLGIAAKCLVEFFPLIQSDATLSLSVSGKFASLEYQFRDGLVVERRQIAEMMLSLLSNVLNKTTMGRWQPTVFQFAHLREKESDELETLLGAPVSFKSRVNRIVFPAEQLSLRRTGVALDQMLLLQEPLRPPCRSNYSRSLIPTLAYEIQRSLAFDQNGMDDIASRLGISRASLFRRLSGLGLQYSDLLLHIRISIAKYYLENSEISLREIASAAGYAEHSAFTRAFTRYMHQSPSDLRRMARIITRSRDMVPDSIDLLSPQANEAARWSPYLVS